MALFESYERRIDKINAVLASTASSPLKNVRKSLLQRASTATKLLEKLSLSASKTQFGLTL